MARKAKQKSGWKGGSFKAAVTGYLKKKVKKAATRAKKSLVKGAKSAIGVKPKRKKK
jgi:methylmalonyl-CoA mutase N-terminal domain/subunit